MAKKETVTDDMLLNFSNQVERLNNIEKYKTAREKTLFIKEIKGVLGTEIKTTPKGVKLVKKPIITRIKDFLSKLFTKF